jgi:hypothetical protein
LVERFWTGLGGVRGRFFLYSGVRFSVVQPLFVFFPASFSLSQMELKLEERESRVRDCLVLG